MRKISGFDPKDCYLDVALSAKAVIEPYSLEQIRDVSAGAATFFVWVSTFMYNVLDNCTREKHVKVVDQRSKSYFWSHEQNYSIKTMQRLMPIFYYVIQ